MNRDEQAYESARGQYLEKGIDPEKAMAQLEEIPLSLHAWQGDDVKGFENVGHALTGGCQVTGNYPGCARNASELRSDLEQALRLLPGSNFRIGLQGHEVDSVKPGQDRDTFSIENFTEWLDWADTNHLGLDIAPVYYSHPKLKNGLSLSSPDPEIREFWIRHTQAIRRIGAEFGRRLKSPCVCNIWTPDGYKDVPADRLAPRRRLKESLDRIFAEKYPETELLDAVESKLFGIGVESYTVGSHDFYLPYAAAHRKLICLDTGHFHPTESIADKLSAILCQQGRILLHISRGVRWDSDHIVILDDALKDLAREAVRSGCGKSGNLFFMLDYFDASVNRLAAWVIGARNWMKALLIALLEPETAICDAEECGDFTARLLEQEAVKTLPWGAIWNHFCATHGVPADDRLAEELRNYEKQVLSRRG